MPAGELEIFKVAHDMMRMEAPRRSILWSIVVSFSFRARSPGRITAVGKVNLMLWSLV